MMTIYRQIRQEWPRPRALSPPAEKRCHLLTVLILSVFFIKGGQQASKVLHE